MRVKRGRTCIYVCKIYCIFLYTRHNNHIDPCSPQQQPSKNHPCHSPIALSQIAHQCIATLRTKETKITTNKQNPAPLRLRPIAPLAFILHSSIQSAHNPRHPRLGSVLFSSTAYQAACPPSILRSDPVINELASLSKNTAAPLYCSGVLKRPSIFWDGQSVSRSGKRSNSSVTI